MKKLLLILTFVLFSFGANAKEETFFIKKSVSAKECVKALEKGKKLRKSRNNTVQYLLDGYMYNIIWDFGWDSYSHDSTSLVIKGCLRSNRIY